MPPRKAFPVELEDGPPGPIHFEVRVNGKTAVAQRVHDFNIDQDARSIMITATVRKSVAPTLPDVEYTDEDE